MVKAPVRVREAAEGQPEGSAADDSVDSEKGRRRRRRRRRREARSLVPAEAHPRTL